MKNRLFILKVVTITYFLTLFINVRGQAPPGIAFSKVVLKEGTSFYWDYVKRYDKNIICLDMYSMGIDSALKILEGCSGLVMTGGEDVDPKFFGRPAEIHRCDTPDHYRDDLEFKLLEYALEHKMPLLGICRGLQMINVYLGGTLIIDIPTDYPTQTKHQCPDPVTCYHPVRPEPGSFLDTPAISESATTNSNHHQAIDRLADGLRTGGICTDGIAEAIEWEDKTGKGFLIGVQYHPERMDPSNPFSAIPGELFIKAAIEYQQAKKK